MNFEGLFKCWEIGKSSEKVIADVALLRVLCLLEVLAKTFQHSFY